MLQAKQKTNYNYSYTYTDYKAKYVQEKNLSRKGFALCMIMLIAAGVLTAVYICQFIQITHLNYRIDILEEEFHGIKEESNLLRYKLAAETSIARIEETARNELNMIEPEIVEIVLLEDVKENEIIAEREEVFFVKVFNNFLEKLSTVKAEEL
ncbi:MAG: hypothetical protein GX175_01550 [Halanaerobiaceae bacterium]|nr:hypothetical protein [Halanaerobiaceae bacterium]